MKYKLKSKLHFYIDQKLVQEERTELIVRALHEEKLRYTSDIKDDENSLAVVFTHKKNLKNYARLKNKLLIVDSNEDYEGPFIEKINFNSMEEISAFIDKVFFIVRRLSLQGKIKESERVFEKIKQYNQDNYSSLSADSIDQKKDLESLLDLELALLKDERIENWNSHFKVFAKKNTQLQHMAILSAEKLLDEDLAFDEGVLILSIPFNDFYLLLKFKSPELIENSLNLELIISMLLRTIQVQDQQLIKSDGEIDFWKKIFAKIPYPMAVISSLGDLLIYNESFAKIGILPKECLRYKDQESLELYQNFYKIRRIEFPIKLMNVSYFIFYTSEGRGQEDLKKITSNDSIKGGVNELGIISSSIAHELNNPLGGILAALSLLSLEDDWNYDELNDLTDMKNGAKRCKELVEIFLGFSRFSPAAAQVPSIKNSLDQAINLTRFRMVESNLRLEIKYSPTLESFNHQINSSIMSMILYLILNELMTSFAHERLITQSHVAAMSGELLEFSNQIVLRLDNDFKYEEKLAQSKLIQHLLVFEKLEISFLQKEIRLIYRS